MVRMCIPQPPAAWLQVRIHTGVWALWAHKWGRLWVIPLDWCNPAAPACLAVSREGEQVEPGSGDENFPFYGCDGLERLKWCISLHREPFLSFGDYVVDSTVKWNAQVLCFPLRCFGCWSFQGIIYTELLYNWIDFKRLEHIYLKHYFYFLCFQDS